MIVSDKLIGSVVIVLLVVMVSCLGVITMVETGVSLVTKKVCIEAGYAEYEVFQFDGYCVTWRDGSKYIVPVSEVQ
jgi:hypothetical protein